MYVKFQGSVGGSLSTTSGNILSEIQGSSYTSYSTIELHNGYLYFTVAPVNSSTTNEMSYVIKGPAVVSGVWYYIGLVYTDKNTPIVAYVNGVTYNQTAAGSNVSAISRVLTPSTSAVGYQVANLANTYSIFSNSTVNMNVRSLQIYNQALSASQISYNYAALYSNTLRYLSGTGESGQVASQSTIPTVEVHDEYNNVIQGFPVYFISTASNGSNDNDSIVFSDSNGDAADSNFTYSTTAGIETTTADTALTGNTAPWYVSPYRWSQQLLFYDTATVGPATKLLLSPAAGFPNGKAALTQPVLTLADQYNNPEYGMADTFSASISGGSVTGTSVSSSTGTGTFSNLAVTGTPGTPYTLTFSSASTGLTTTQSRVVPGSAVDTAMTFDGTTTYGATGSLSMSQLSDTSTTAEAWVKPVAGSCNSQQVVFTRNTVGGSNAVNYSWALVCASNYWDAFYYNTADSTWHSMQLGPVEFGQWQHLAYSFSSSNWLFVGYMNGIATIQQAIPNTTTFNTTASPLLVGDNANRVQMFNGQIDELKMWNVVRTTTQINADMNSWGPIAANNNLAIYYDFNDITGTTVYDKAWNSVSAEDLSITGTVATTDMKSSQTCTLASHTCIAFTRTYLNPFGGWQIPSTATNASVVVVAGGGGGTAQTDKTGYVGGGGGAGGYQKFNNATLTPNAYVPVIVGAGGYGGFTFTTGWGLGLNGTNSQFGSLAASIGGGAGGGMSTATTGTVNGASGGSGGGGGTHFSTGGGLGGGATSGQGNVGGYALDESLYSGYGSGGGGGAAGAGAYSTSSTSPALGSDGVINPFYGSVYLAGGGNGAGGSATTYYTTAGSAHGSTATGASASANTGSGGGGGGGGTTAINAGTGGTGVILFEYITALPIVSNPINESATAGTTTTFFDTNTVVSGVTRTYTWQYSSDSGSTWRTAPNGTATAGTPSGSAGSGQVLANGSYVTPTLTTVMNNYQYRVIVVDTDSFGVSDTTTATAALLTVNPPMRLSGAAGSATYGISNAGLGTAYVQVATGTGTAPYIFTLNTPSSTYYLDTSTASQGFVNLVITSAPAGNLVETVTVTDASGLTAQLPAATLISQAPTTTGFTANPAIYGQPDTLTATVSESTIFTTAGMVTFKDGSNNVLCTTSVFNVSDQASCAWTPGSTNTYYITAYFVDGAGNFASSQSSATPITPGKASVTESLTATSAVVAGATGVNALQLIATLNQTGSLAPTGTIAFTVNGATACGSAPVSTTNSLTTASCTYQAQGAGLQTVTATYLGDTSFNGANASTTTSISSCSQNVSTNNYLTGAPGSGYCAVEFTTGTSVWTVPTGVVNAQVLIVGGGGAGGERAGGGGGSGELLYTTIGTPLTLATTTDTITVGAGGQIETSGERGSVGGTSSLSLTTSTIYSAYGGGYGGGGGRTGVCGSTGGSSGGNDGGTGYCTTSPTATSHSSYSGFTSLVNNGGYGTDNNAGGDAERWSGGGGGGAGAAGGAGVTTDSYTGTGTNQKYTTAGSGGSGASVAIALNSATGATQPAAAVSTPTARKRILETLPVSAADVVRLSLVARAPLVERLLMAPITQQLGRPTPVRAAAVLALMTHIPLRIITMVVQVQVDPAWSSSSTYRHQSSPPTGMLQVTP
jgi:hypothetical protein